MYRKTLIICAAMALPSCGERAATRLDLNVAPASSVDLGSPWLDALGTPSYPFLIAGYGPVLQRNKRRLVKALRDLRASRQNTIAIVAIAMQETQHMDAGERDASKDGSPLSASLSCLNMNMDMLGRLGYSRQSGPDLNRNEQVYHAAKYALRAIRAFSLNGLLAFHRAGATGYEQFRRGGQDGYRRNDTMDIQGYIDGFVTIATQIENDPRLLDDDRRVDVYVEHRLRR